MYYSSVNLSRHTTLCVPAIARWFISIDEIDKLSNAIAFAKESKLEIVVLGGGSNVVFTENFNGLIMCNNLMGREIIEEDDDSVVVEVSAGENWHDLVVWSLSEKIYGIENLALIPGKIGAAPIQNIGAYDVQLSDVFESLDYVDLKTGATKTMDNKACAFGYRDSIFKNKLLNKTCITKIRIRLNKEPQIHSEYPTLKNYLNHHRMKLSPNNIFKAICSIRRTRLPDPEKIPNAGSFFKNPVISKTAFKALTKKLSDVTHTPQENGKIKVSAAYLLDKSGWKGYRSNGLSMHLHQPLVLTNNRKRSGKDILEFAGKITASIAQEYSIQLEIEPQIYPTVK